MSSSPLRFHRSTGANQMQRLIAWMPHWAAGGRRPRPGPAGVGARAIHLGFVASASPARKTIQTGVARASGAGPAPHLSVVHVPRIGNGSRGTTSCSVAQAPTAPRMWSIVGNAAVDVQSYIVVTQWYVSLLFLYCNVPAMKNYHLTSLQRNR